MAASTAVAASRKHVELSLELKRKLIQEHEHGVPFTLLGKKYHIATSTAANIWRKKDFFLRSRMSGSRKRCNDRSKYKIVNQVTALFVKSMLERNHKIDGEVIKRFARTAAAQCNFKDFHGSNGWLDSFKKRENVCWVRRRGERAAAAAAASASASGPAPGSASSTAATSATSSPCQQHGYRADSPNLGAAAAAAAVAASTQQQHHHHQRQLRHHQDQRLAEASGRESPAGAPESNRCAWAEGDELACTRCTHIAAAAAALAALNSSDSIHERDHEIDDWFHGIPFLCQFFEEYQSMHQQQEPAAAAAAAPALAVQQPNSFSAALPTSSSASSSASSSSSTTAAASTSVSSSAASSTCALLHSSSSQQQHQQPHHLQHHQHQHQQQHQQAHSQAQQPRGPHSPPRQLNAGPARSMSDAHELMDTALAGGLQFRSSASMADLQQCAGPDELPRTISSEEMARMGQQQQHYGDAMNYELEGGKRAFQQQQLLAARGSGANLDLAEHQMMEINFSGSNANSSDDSLQANQQHQHQMQHLCGRRDEHQMELVVKGASQAEPMCCQQASCSSNLVSSDYNSDDQDAFYLPAARYARHAHHHHSADAHSDDLAYQDDLHDCCSDHYQDSASGGRELQLQADYQAELVSQVVVVANSSSQQQQQQQTGYMDEYEYENISTIRHYPVPMASHQMQQQQQQSATPSAFALASPGEPETQQFGADQHQAPLGQVDAMQQLQGGACAHQLAAGFLSAASSPGRGQLGAAAAAATDYNGPGKRASCAEYLQEQEQGIEHADHEEHNLLHNALMRSPEKLKLIDSIITLLNYASSYNRKMLAPLHEIKRCIERDLEVVLSDTSNEQQQQQRQQQVQLDGADNSGKMVVAD